MAEFSLSRIRADFPALTQKVRGKPFIYLDSAATSLKPWPVIERISHFHSYEASNVHRGAHYFADKATQSYEEAREKVRSFLNAAEREEIVFTKGTTEGINLVASTWAKKNLNEGDEILLTEMEHHANLVPWFDLAEQKKLKIKYIPIDESGTLDLSKLDSLLTSKTKLLAVTHCSNTLGTVNDVARLAKAAHAVGAKILVDGAQTVTFQAVDVTNLDVDFYAFSGHKMFAGYGIGILYVKKNILENMPPYQFGGSMISCVEYTGATYNVPPYRFEAGTPNIEGVISMTPAIDYILGIGYENIQKHKAELMQACEQLKEIPGLRMLGTSAHKGAIVAFSVEGMHHSDIGSILDQEGIAVRVGHHCTEPLHKKLGVTGSVRASFSVFNQKSDVEALWKGLLKCREMLA